jgi:PAS domain-containing protein
MEGTEITARDQYHQSFDLLDGGVFMILADGTERVVFASSRTAALYECGSEEEFLKLCSSRFRGMVDFDDYKPLDEIAGNHPEHFYFSFHYQTKKGYFRKEQHAAAGGSEYDGSADRRREQAGA